MEVDEAEVDGAEFDGAELDGAELDGAELDGAVFVPAEVIRGGEDGTWPPGTAALWPSKP